MHRTELGAIAGGSGTQERTGDAINSSGRSMVLYRRLETTMHGPESLFGFVGVLEATPDGSERMVFRVDLWLPRLAAF